MKTDLSIEWRNTMCWFGAGWERERESERLHIIFKTACWTCAQTHTHTYYLYTIPKRNVYKMIVKIFLPSFCYPILLVEKESSSRYFSCLVLQNETVVNFTGVLLCASVLHRLLKLCMCMSQILWYEFSRNLLLQSVMPLLCFSVLPLQKPNQVIASQSRFDIYPHKIDSYNKMCNYCKAFSLNTKLKSSTH